jgi:hypothetical protein
LKAKTKPRKDNSRYTGGLECTLRLKSILKAATNVKGPEKIRGVEQLLQALCSEPKQRIHMDLFGLYKTMSLCKNLILCMTDAFSNTRSWSNSR